MKLEAPMKISSGVRNITQVVSETLPFFFGRVLGGRLARGKLRKNYKCLKTTKSLVVVSREESCEKITSVGKRLSPWWSSRARFTWDLCFFGQVLVVVSRDVYLGLVIFRPSVGGRLARRSPGTCDFSAQS